MTPTPPPDDWIPWTGGECPVPDKARVWVRYRDGAESHNAWRAESYTWDHQQRGFDIIAYKLAQSQKGEPMRTKVQRFWLQSTKSFDGAPQRESFDDDDSFHDACREYGAEWRQQYECCNVTCTNRDCPQHYPMLANTVPPSAAASETPTVQQLIEACEFGKIPFNAIEDRARELEARARLAEADVALVNWLETQGKDYGSDKGSSSIRPMKQWCVTKAGHGGTFRDTARAAIANDAK